MKRIDRIAIEVINDPTSAPDDTLGRYTDQYEDGAIDRQELGDMKRGQFRYFVPAMSAETTGNPESPLQDYKRAEAFNGSEWCYTGIRASAYVATSRDGQTWKSSKLSSAGLWGVESDCGEDYGKQIALEELDSLRDELQEFGFSAADIVAAVAKLESQVGGQASIAEQFCMIG